MAKKDDLAPKAGKAKGKSPAEKTGNRLEKTVMDALEVKGQTVVPPDVLAEALDRLITEPKLQDRLQKQPLKALEELGVQVDPKARTQLAGKSLDDLMEQDLLSEVAFLPAAFVAVLTRGTRPGTNTRVGATIKSGTKATAATSTATATATATSSGIKSVVGKMDQ